MKFVVWIACILAFAAQLAVAGDGAARPGSIGHTPDSVDSVSFEVNPGGPEDCDGGDTCQDGTCGDGIVNGGCEWNTIAKPVASDAASNDEFGYSVSVSGDTVVVGARFDDDRGAGSGSAYVFGRNMGGADAWGQVAKLIASDGATSDGFGASVAIDEDTIVVGAFGDDDGGSRSGSAYVFEREVGGAGAWIQVAKLTASDAAVDDQFGWSVSVSGDTVVVGALFGYEGGASAGSAYVFERDAGGSDAWGQVAKLTASDAASFDLFGYSVAVSGGTVAVGARDDDDAGSSSGSAYVFERNAGGSDAWGQVAKLTASDGAPGDQAGSSVAVNGDTVVVGARFGDHAGSDPGSAYVFERNVGGADAWGQVVRLTASAAGHGDQFGVSVTLSGDTLVVGANRDAESGSGSAYVFERNAGGADAWRQVARLTASDAGADDRFGTSVAVSGDTVVVGANLDDDAGSASGSAYILTRGEVCDDESAGSDATPGACQADCTGPNEACDDGANNSDTIPDACRTDCTLAACGDGVTDTGEECDDGGNEHGDGCNASCRSEFCGDGIVNNDGTEECDDGNASDDDGCNASCHLITCGDGLREGPEECDDGTFNSDTVPNACRRDCTLPRCGDDVADSGEACDDGAFNSHTAPDACRTNCTLPSCGDGVTDTGEVCDDGNTDDGDSCSATCQSGCGDAVLEGHEECDEGAANSDVAPNACRADCTLPGCGDNVRDDAEACDDGASNSDTARDACRTDCTTPRCGDGVADTGEECDDGNTSDGDGCGATCQRECSGDMPEWNTIAKVVASDAALADGFGRATSVSGDTLVVGSSEDDDAGYNSGSAYVFERNFGGADAWGQVTKLTASDAAVRAEFGGAVALSGDTIVIGAHRNDDDAGSAYVFERNVGGADAWGQAVKLTADARAYFGRSVSISGDTIVVGASFDDDAGVASGSAYVFERNAGGAGAWGQVAKLTASDAASRDYFGNSVSVSGNTVVVGALGDDDDGSLSGSAYVFERNAGGADAWGQAAKLSASGGRRDDRFGISVSVDGDRVVVGADGVDGPYNSGSAYLFERSVGGVGAWGQLARLTASDADGSDYFGESVALSGNRVVVGAYGNNDAGSDSGSAYVFERNVGGAGAWEQVTKLTAFDAAADDHFGRAVSVSGDTVVVGARRDDDAGSGSGSVSIWAPGCVTCGDRIREALEECDDGTANSDTLPDACRTDCALPGCGDGVADSGEACDDGASNSDMASDACRSDCTFAACGDGTIDTGEECDDGNTHAGDGCNATCRLEFCGDGIAIGPRWPENERRIPFGTIQPSGGGGVSVSLGGDTLVAGAWGDEVAGTASGSANVFERNLDGADAWGQAARLTASDAVLWDLFGGSVSVAGDRVVVGASGDDDRGVNSGSAYVFERNAGGADAWTQVAKLTASDGTPYDYFGVAVSASGDTIAVGAYRDDDGGPNSGSVYVFEPGPGGTDGWVRVAKLTASDAAASDHFGGSVSVSGDRIVVGATHLNNEATNQSGAAYVFERNAGGANAWGQVARLTVSDSAGFYYFGDSVSVSGDTVVVGARFTYNDAEGRFDFGAAYVFERNAGGAAAWGQVAKLTASDLAHGEQLGGAVSVSGDTIVVGRGDDRPATGSNLGFAYVFERDLGGAGAWGQLARLTASEAASRDDFGGFVSVSGDTVVVGDRSGESSKRPSAYIMTLESEECDDGNIDDGDGCSATCQTEMIPNLIANGGFEQRVPWRFFTSGMGMLRIVGEEAVVTIGNSGGNTQLFQRFDGLVAGTYTLDFDVKSSVATRARTILVNETDRSWIAQAGFRARPTWSHVTSTLVVPADVPAGLTTTRLSFYMPGVPDGTTLHFDNVVLRRVGPN